MKKHRVTYMMVCGVSVFVPVVLAIGSFLGFPGDALLGGIYWLLVACWTALYTYNAPKPRKAGFRQRAAGIWKIRGGWSRLFKRRDC